MNNSLRCTCGLVVIAAMLLPGCKAAPAKSAGFVPNWEQMKKDDRLPFHAVWYDSDADWDAYNKAVVRPVNTQYVRDQGWWEEASLKDKQDFDRDLKRFARLFQDRIKSDFRTLPNNRFKVTETPSANTLVFELAIVELVPTKAWLNAAGMIGLGMSFDKGSVAIEGRVRDGATNELIATFADREQGKSAVISVADLTWYSHAEDIIKDWSRQIVECVNAPEDAVIADSPTFTLKAW